MLTLNGLNKYKALVTTSIKLVVCFLTLVISPLSIAADNDDKLKQVQQQIKQKRQQLNQQLSEKNTLEGQFKSAELKVAEVAIQLRHTNNKISSINNKIAKLEKELQALQIKQKQHQGALAEMIRTAYINGKHDYTKLLLSQNSPAQLERLIIYYRSLNDARAKQLEEILVVVEELKQVEQQLNEQKQTLNSTKQQQQQDKQQLAVAQKNRKAALRKLNAAISSDQQKLKKLQQNEQRLLDAIESAQRQIVKSPKDLIGLYNLKKKLKWPTKGKLSKKFGQRRANSVRWKGVLIDGELGNRVNSIADGIVLYSDWLKGFGWVTIVDHGKAYMSLYGHNQALLKQVGEFVEQGEPIALVGESGGQTKASLYFEIRYKGKTVNPARWCR